MRISAKRETCSDVEALFQRLCYLAVLAQLALSCTADCHCGRAPTGRQARFR